MTIFQESSSVSAAGRARHRQRRPDHQQALDRVERGRRRRRDPGARRPDRGPLRRQPAPRCRCSATSRCVGALFRSEIAHASNRTNLMVFLRPVVMRDGRRRDQAVARPLRPDPRAAEETPAAPSLRAADQRGAGRCRRCAGRSRRAASTRRRCRRPPDPAPAAAAAAAAPTEAAPWAPATPCPTPSPRPTRCCSRTTAAQLTLWAGEHAVGQRAVRGAARVRRAALRARGRRPRWPSASPRPMPAANRAPRR